MQEIYQAEDIGYAIQAAKAFADAYGADIDRVSLKADVIAR